MNAMMKICISGLTGSGKTTLGSMLAKELNIAHITKETAKEYAKIAADAKKDKSGKLLIRQAADPRYARDFDRDIAEAAKGKNCVVTTWLGPWLIKDATLRVWLNASLDERAARKSRDMKISMKKAREYVIEKDGEAAKGFKKVYGIDIYDHSLFDVEISTQLLPHGEVIAVISMLAMLREGIKK